MKKLFHLTLMTLLFVGSASCQKKTYAFKITYIQPYCGGAKPTPEMEEESRKLKPYSGKTVFFVSESGKTDSARTNEKGQLKIKLPLGNYKVFEDWRFHKKTANNEDPGNFDASCLQQEWNKHFMTVSIEKKKITKITENPIVQYCSWNAPCQNETHLPPTRPQK